MEKGNKKKFYKKWWFWVIVIIALFIMIGSSDDTSTSTSEKDRSNNEAVVEQEVKSESDYVFNVPELLNKTLSEIEAELGEPTSYIKPPQSYIENSTIRTWEKTWYRNDHTFMITYNIDTNDIEDYFLGGGSDEVFERFRDTNYILEVGNMTNDSNNYTVEFVKALKDPSTHTGAIIRKK